MHVRSLLSPAAATLGSAVMFATSFDSGVIATAIAGVGMAAIGLYGYFMDRRTKAYKEAEAAKLEAWKHQRHAEVEAEAERERVLGPSITRQLQDAEQDRDEIKTLLADAKQEAKSAREQAKLTLEENRKLTAEIVELMRRDTERIVRHTDANIAHSQVIKERLAKVEAATAVVPETAEIVKGTAGKVDAIKQAVEHKVGSSDSLPAMPVTPKQD